MARPPSPPDSWAAAAQDNRDGSWTLHARIDRVVDGDSVWVWVITDKGFGRMSVDPENIRLARINAPEKNRASTAVAGRAAMVWAQGQFASGLPVMLTTRYDRTLGRLVGEITRTDGLNWSDAAVQAGHATYKEY